MNLFIDTEFSSLNAPKLLSIGLVADDGRELNVEIADDRIPILRHVQTLKVERGDDCKVFDAMNAVLLILVSFATTAMGELIALGHQRAHHLRNRVKRAAVKRVFA